MYKAHAEYTCSGDATVSERPDEGELSVELAVLRHIYVCSYMNMSLSRCWWCIIVGNDSIEGNAHVSYRLHL